MASAENIEIKQFYGQKQDLEIDEHGNGIKNTIRMLHMELDLLLSESKSIADKKGADIVRSRFPLMAVAVTDLAVTHFLSNPDEYEMPAIANLEANILGGVGTLTTTKSSGGAKAVTARFGPERLKEPEFADQLHNRVSTLFKEVKDNPDIAFDELAEEQRLKYLKELFFGDLISNEEMLVVSSYVTDVFASLLNLAPRDMLREGVPGLKLLMPFLPEDLARKKDEADEILDGVIRRKLMTEKGDSQEDLFDFLIRNTVFDEGVDLDTKVSVLRSDSLQVLFAAKETTPSGVGAVLNFLANNQDVQDNLRGLVSDFFTQKGSDVLTYEDLMSHHPAMMALHTIAGRVLVENPPTPLTARRSREKIELDNGEEISKGTDIYLSLGDAAKQQLERGWELNDVEDVVGLLIFGHSRKKCKGGPFAVMEMISTMAYWLYNSERIELVDQGEKVMTTTAFFKGMNFRLS